MNTKRNLITREMVVKANAAMVEKQSANLAGLPLRVVSVIRETKISREEMNRAYAEARRTVETHA
jgi:hypothetical protein